MKETSQIHRDIPPTPTFHPLSLLTFFFNNPIKEIRLVVRRAEITDWSGRGGDFFFRSLPQNNQCHPPPNPSTNLLLCPTIYF